ncbi:hypothetical protein [Sphingobium sp. Sx8-8]|uniref:hypothetical protein n=1 Tax=Sphingobium sp. Sx8-8 TaxID=2933617 RepID=UPI001F567788|nr:hypothetical protein [Sphingobium sp. Sx8-8]
MKSTLVAEPHSADDLVLSRYRKALLVQRFLELHPLRHAGQADDQVYIVSGPHLLQGDFVGDEHGGRAPAYKHHLLAQIIAQCFGDSLQHCEKFTLKAHARAIRSSNLSWARFASR